MILPELDSCLLSKLNIDTKTFYKMHFIYKAISSGWTVKIVGDNKFEFINSDKDLKKEFILENFLDNFINQNLSIENLVIND